ncbi:hypothetical protein ColLi_09567 [Colletotrichum liriopes]|uniref:Uncharacterized protein n=1 Tax=Colletotrichum liriopes TaxID=708192 RepID=A0AA37GT12_9PEZI|nr:hypothetical protein ColLi_09567 [Colletotrichum liriopes]
MATHQAKITMPCGKRLRYHPSNNKRHRATCRLGCQNAEAQLEAVPSILHQIPEGLASTYTEGFEQQMEFWPDSVPAWV